MFRTIAALLATAGLRLDPTQWFSALIAMTLAAALAPAAQAISLDNGVVRRELVEDSGVWRTTAFVRADGRDRLTVSSDEVHVLLFDGTRLTIGDYEAEAPPTLEHAGGQHRLRIDYRRRAHRMYPRDAPHRLEVAYFARDGEPYLRKDVRLAMEEGTTVDRLEVERFITRAPATRGGRGEPVYLGGRWFVGVEYPAAHSRHTDGNTPRAGSGRFDAVGNYSSIDLEGHEVDPAVPGLVRLMHFPGHARRQADGSWGLVSKTAVAGTGDGASVELVFRDYMKTIQRPPRSFLNYNNWFDPDGKKLGDGGLLEVWRRFRAVLDPAGIRMDAMVPDDGWQDKRTVYEPAAVHFPGGLADLAVLGKTLRDEGTTLGLWLALSSYNARLPEAYPRASANAYFAGFKPYHPLSHPRYKDELGAQLRRLVRDGGISYLKHDFNPLCDVADGRGHPATERHGHEAELDAMLELVALERGENPSLYLNVTNWIWFSPWWLTHADALWMLAGDDGWNGNWPELSGRAMATTDRDTYLWRMWGDPAERPLVPISSLMTHGIIRNVGGKMESPQDTVADWADHVVMHYGRGVLLKEWYITPATMSPDHWKALLRVHRWSEARLPALANTVYVGGRPDEGQVYGYVGWDGERGVLAARNPQARAQVLTVPVSEATLYAGSTGRPRRARVLYPYRSAAPQPLDPGATLAFELPGYATMVIEIEPGEGTPLAAPPAAPAVRRKGRPLQLDVPDEPMSRCDLLVIGYPDLPAVRLDGRAAAPRRTSDGQPNRFARYAKAGMASEKARPWTMAAYDLGSHRGRTVEVEIADEGRAFEAFWLLDRPAPDPAAEDVADLPWPVGQGYRRQTIELVSER